MIEAVPKSASSTSKANAVCDSCGARALVTCDYSRGGRKMVWMPNAAQVLRKLPGWATVKGRLLCPACDRARKHKEAPMAAEAKTTATEKVLPLRQPTREQRREIVGLLEASYDTSAERYRGRDTDQTLAEAIGGGCMAGWVAEIREAMFGPDGGNDEIETLRRELAELRARMEPLLARMRTEYEAFSGRMEEFGGAIGKVAEFEKRLDAIRASVGPRGGCGHDPR